ncbi:MAG: STAS domain-containing protein [Lachnospiraceae bacterium]|nr:STAS domain-containing protein [Lachnospiraceae bacterium]
MTIKKIKEGSTVEFYFEGWMDTQNVDVLAQALNELEDSTKQLSFNMEGLEYISSAGIRQIVAAHKQMKGNLILKNVTQEIMAVFHMTGLDKMLNIE